MKRGYLPIFFLIIIILSFTFASCLPPASASSSTAVTASSKQILELEAKVKTLTEENAKQTTSITELQNNKLSKSEYTPSSNTYAKTELYTRAEVEKLIAESKTSLQSQIDALKSSGTTTSTTVVTNDVTISLYKDVANPIYNSGQYTWWLKIKNGYAEYKKIFINAAISATGSGSSIGSIDTGNTFIYAPDLVGGMSPASSPAGKFSMNFVPSSGVSCTLIGANSQGYVIVKGGNEIVIPVTLNLIYISSSTGTQWSDVAWSRTVLNYP